jgi:hypothetical protein
MRRAAITQMKRENDSHFRAFANRYQSAAIVPGVVNFASSCDRVVISRRDSGGSGPRGVCVAVNSLNDALARGVNLEIKIRR